MSMMPTIFDKRPPFVRFEEMEMGINAQASQEAGRPIPRVIVMACITPHGSKDVVEKVADEWIEQVHQKSLRGEYPLEWVAFFRASYAEWKKGNDLPREGTPVKTWQMCTREASKRLVAVGITTVEDLAEFPDSNLSVIGMDGRYLRDMARGWINESKDKGANTKALADANVKLEELHATIGRQSERIERLEARLEARDEAAPRGPGRPRKSEAA